MKLHRSLSDALRASLSWHERWEGPDDGLIACWERGREKGREAPQLADQALAGELVPLPWKGGVEKVIKGPKFGTLYYLAMWQGLKGEDLNIDTLSEVALTCTATGQLVTFSGDSAKWAASAE